MKILIITKEFYPSTAADAKRFTGISRYFVEQGHHVTVICDTDNGESFHERLDVINVKKIGRDSMGMLERLISHSAFSVQTVLKGYNLKDIEVVIATSPPSFNLISGRILAKKHKSYFVADLRDIWPDVFVQTDVMKESSIVYKAFDRISRRAYKSADLISVVTPGKQELLSAKYPEYTDKIKYLSNGFNKEILENSIDSEISSKFLGNFNVIYTGKIGLAQDPTNLIDLATEFSSIKELQFHIFGNGNGVVKMQEIIDERQLTNIHFYGYRSEEVVTTALRHSQIAYVSLGSEKLIDSVPTKMYEAMLFGCPVLLSAKGDSVSLLDEMSFGKASLPNDYQTLKSNFEYLMNNNKEYQDIKEEVRNKLLEKYSRDVVAGEYLTLISDLNKNN